MIPREMYASEDVGVYEKICYCNVLQNSVE